MSCINENYMEYSIMATNRCNLKCKHCINRGLRDKAPELEPDAEKVISYIQSDISKHRYEPVVITFYGGEPLLALDFISAVVAGTRNLSPMYNVFTNGIMVLERNLELLNRMHMVSISIDGDREEYDRVRGKGTHNKVLGNYLALKSAMKSNVIAFVTLTLRSDVYASVTGLKEHFNNIFWFLENSAGGSPGELEAFIGNYRNGVRRLLDDWIDGMKKGKVRGFIPFQGLYDIIRKKHEYSGMPCGIGNNFQAIAIDGSVYSCEDSYHNNIGSITGGVDIKKAREKSDFSICGNCEVRQVCAGRCFIPHLNFSGEKVRFYCECTKTLIGSYRERLPEIEKLIADKIIREELLLNRLTRFTDVIP